MRKQLHLSMHGGYYQQVLSCTVHALAIWAGGSPRILQFALRSCHVARSGGPPREPRPPKPWWVGPSGVVIWGTEGNGLQTCKGVGQEPALCHGAMATAVHVWAPAWHVCAPALHQTAAMKCPVPRRRPGLPGNEKIAHLVLAGGRRRVQALDLAVAVSQHWLKVGKGGMGQARLNALSLQLKPRPGRSAGHLPGSTADGDTVGLRAADVGTRAGAVNAVNGVGAADVPVTQAPLQKIWPWAQQLVPKQVPVEGQGVTPPQHWLPDARHWPLQAGGASRVGVWGKQVAAAHARRTRMHLSAHPAPPPPLPARTCSTAPPGQHAPPQLVEPLAQQRPALTPTLASTQAGVAPLQGDGAAADGARRAVAGAAQVLVRVRAARAVAARDARGAVGARTGWGRRDGLAVARVAAARKAQRSMRHWCQGVALVALRAAREDVAPSAGAAGTGQGKLQVGAILGLGGGRALAGRTSRQDTSAGQARQHTWARPGRPGRQGKDQGLHHLG